MTSIQIDDIMWSVGGGKVRTNIYKVVIKTNAGGLKTMEVLVVLIIFLIGIIIGGGCCFEDHLVTASSILGKPYINFPVRDDKQGVSMRKCVCGNILRSVAHTCPECGRTYYDNLPFIERLQRIGLALSLIREHGTRVEVAEAEQAALACLAENLSLFEIAERLEHSSKSCFKWLAHILKNLNT